MRINKILSLSIVSLAIATAAGAAGELLTPLPQDATQLTTLTATVAEQATVTVPTDIAFAVSDITADTASTTGTSVTVTDIVLDSGNKLQILVSSAATSFTGIGTGTTFTASDVRWSGAAVWSTGGAATASGTGGLTSTPKEIATCTGVAACNTSDAIFSLKGDSAVTLAGAQTLTMTWRFASI